MVLHYLDLDLLNDLFDLEDQLEVVEGEIHKWSKIRLRYRIPAVLHRRPEPFGILERIENCRMRVQLVDLRPLPVGTITYQETMMS